jgi:ATP-dependent RNA helicase UAP56/SUB2/complement component 1 Q subcomponent-binding protein
MATRRLISALLQQCSRHGEAASTSLLQPRLAGVIAANVGTSSGVISAAAAARASLGFRSMHTSVAMHSGLFGILDEELKHEKKEYAAPAAVTGGPPAPFTLSEAPGDTMLTLSRSFGSGETVTVDLHVNNQPGVEGGSLEGDEDAGSDADDELSTVVSVRGIHG